MNLYNDNDQTLLFNALMFKGLKGDFKTRGRTVAYLICIMGIGCINFYFLKYSPIFQVVSQSNWLPESLTPAAGKELEKLSFLGPFLALSVCCLKYSPIFQVVSQSNWLPESVTPAAGKELEKLSFLGPFLALSVFAV